MTPIIKLRLLAAIAALCPFFAFSAPAKADAPYCREYTESVWVGGKRAEAYGTACLQPDGDWKIVSAQGASGYNPSGQIRLGEVVSYGRPVDHFRAPQSRIVVVENRYRPYYYSNNHRHKHPSYKGRHYDRHHDRYHGRSYHRQGYDWRW